MKSLYFDLIGGISGDMTVAALLDLGVSLKFLQAELRKINLKNYLVRKSHVQRGHIRATKFNCCVRLERNYSYKQIIDLIDNSRLSKKVKTNFRKVYDTLKNAEVAVHGHRHDNIHFHQLGEIDSIVDIASVCICLEALKIDQLFFGTIPLANMVSPAAFNLLEGKNVYFTGEPFENITPTGVALLTALGRQMDTHIAKDCRVVSCGYGAGSYDAPHITNVLRVVRLEEEKLCGDEIYVIETNIDDMNPQFFEVLFEKLFEAGALDVFMTSIYMKKTRPGFLLTVLSNPEKLGMMSSLILSHTSTLGVRYYPVRRLKLARKTTYLRYRGSRIRLKHIQLPNGVFRVTPEYEDCKALAKKLNISISKIYDEIKEKGNALMTA